MNLEQGSRVEIKQSPVKRKFCESESNIERNSVPKKKKFMKAADLGLFL